jgi:hypothetical protein
MAILNLPPANPNNLIISYITLRKIIGWMGITLVPILVLGSFWLDHTSQIQVSVSAYYYTHMRNALVGIICGISLFLLSYHGYSWKDSLASKLAGIFSLGIAFFPTSETNNAKDIISTLHFITSGIFFIILAYMSLFLFTKTSGDMTPEKLKRNWVYRICGVIMVACILGIAIISIPTVHAKIPHTKLVITMETLALEAFGLSWLTKGELLLKDK